MKTIPALQGTDEWLAARAKRFTASEAPAMMGASKYQTRTALLRQKHTGLAAEVDDNTQRLFDRGHTAEAAARPIVEAIIGEILYPETGTLEVDGLPLLASFDGLTDMEDIAWESKLWNASLADAVRAGQLEPHYYWQLEQQLLVSGADRVYFTTSDGTPENTVGMWYTAVPGRREQLIAGWKQFAEDLANYQHVEQAVAPVGVTIEALPALLVQVEGRVLATNLDAFKQAAQTFIAGIKTELVNDQDFADADKMVKFLKDGEDRLAQAKQHALAQTASIDELFRTVDAISEQMRGKRLALDKLVKAEKENRRTHILNDACVAIAAHINKLNERIGGRWMPVELVSAARFAEAIKGLKSLDSMRDKVSAALANAKIEANEIADRIEINRKSIDSPYENLLPDFAAVCTKAPEDFTAMMAVRIAAVEKSLDDARKAEDARVAAAVEAERKAGESRAAEAIEAERMAEAKRAAEAAQQSVVDHCAANGLPLASDGTQADQDKFGVITIEARNSAVIEHQDEIAEFMASREWGKDSGKIRAALVEFVKFQAERLLKVAA